MTAASIEARLRERERTRRLTTTEETNARVGCNVGGRLEAIAEAANNGADAIARAELLELLRFFPRYPSKGREA